MLTIPSPREFRELSRSGRSVPVATCLPWEGTAADLFQAVDFPPPRILLESARTHPVIGRYSILVGEPSLALIAKSDEVELRTQTGTQILKRDPFSVLQELLEARRAVRLEGLPPFVGGAVGYFSYDAGRLIEPLPVLAEDDLELPYLEFIFCDEAVVLDHVARRLWVIVLAEPEGASGNSYDQAVARVESLVQRATRSFGGNSAARFPLGTSPARIRSTHTRDSFEAMVRKGKEFIAAGDIYQANLSQRFTLPMQEDPWLLYRRLTQMNPSPFALFADFGSLQVVSASPERLLRVTGQRVETRPIAGTRPRGQTSAETLQLRQELLLNDKERAEHLMLVDLERNDLGRVCRYGTVQVDELMALEEYSHVIHIVSNVRGDLKPSVGLRDLLAAVFPGGTITGCPKIRCMQVIESLEPVRRHLYTGSFGYLSYTGDMDLNLLIRTAFVQGSQVYIHAGAGIVADSDPSREYEETLHKARALLEIFAPVRPEPPTRSGASSVEARAVSV